MIGLLNPFTSQIRKQCDAIKPKLQQTQRDNDERREDKANRLPKAAASDLEQECVLPGNISPTTFAHIYPHRARHIAVVLEKLKKIRVKVEDLEGVY